MSRLHVITLTLGTMVVLGAVSAGSASAALPEVLSVGGAVVKFTSTAGVSTFETAAGRSVVCKKLVNTGEITTGKVGTVTFDFEECESAGVKCDDSGDATGVILVKEAIEFVFTKEVGTLEAGVLLQPTEAGEKVALIECTALVKIAVTKAVVCPVTPINTDTTTFVIKCEQEKGKQKPQNYTNDKKETKSTQLLASLNGGALENVGLLTSDTVTTSVLMEIMA